jgi:hypothetical protein
VNPPPSLCISLNTTLKRFQGIFINLNASNVRIGKHLSHNFPIQDGLKLGDALSPLLFNFALEYAIRKVQLLAYAYAVNLLGDNIDTKNRNTDTLIYSSEEVGLEVNTEKSKHTLLSHHQNAGQNHDIKIANRSFENVSQFKYSVTTVRNQN